MSRLSEFYDDGVSERVQGGIKEFMALPQKVIAGNASSLTGVYLSASPYQTSWQHTIDMHADRFLVVGALLDRSTAIQLSAVTANGIAMSLIGRYTLTINSRVRTAELWGLVNPASGLNTIQATASTSCYCTFGAVDFYGVNQLAPASQFTTGTGTGVSSALSLAPGYGFCLGICGKVQTSDAFLDIANQVRVYQGNDGSPQVRGVMSYKDGRYGDNLSEAWSVSTSFLHAGCVILPA